MRRTQILVLVVLSIALCLSSTRGDDELPAVELNGVGSTTAVAMLAQGTPLTPAWISAFQTLTGGKVATSYRADGSGEGEASIIAKNVDFGVSSCPLSEAELETVDGALIHFPIMLGALDITYSFPAGTISGTLNLTADIISAIYQGQIRSWNHTLIKAQNPKLNYTGRITPFARHDSAGANQVFTNYLSVATMNYAWNLTVTKLLDWPAPVTEVVGDNSLVKAVAATPGSIGYSNYGVPASVNLPSAALRNSDGNFVLPSQSSIGAAALAFESGGQYPEGTQSWSHVTLVNQPGPNTWPLAHYEFAMFYEDQRDTDERGAALAAFMNYIMSTQAQAATPAFKHVPLGNGIRGVNIASLNKMLLDDDYTILSYWNPYPPPPDNESHDLLPGTIGSLVVISIFGLFILVGIVLFTFLEWRQNNVEFL